VNQEARLKGVNGDVLTLTVTCKYSRLSTHTRISRSPEASKTISPLIDDIAAGRKSISEAYYLEYKLGYDIVVSLPFKIK
jgi:hypothetical protein